MKLFKSISWFFRVIFNALNRFWWDDCFSRASALAYSSLFALVPLFWLVISLATAFGFKEDYIDRKVNDLFDRLLPGVYETVDTNETSEQNIVTSEIGLDAVLDVDQKTKKLDQMGASTLVQFRAQVVNYLKSFTENIRALTALKALTIGSLLFIAIALFNTIESALNVIWRVTSNQSIMSKIFDFAGLIVLGPASIFLSILLSEYFFKSTSSIAGISYLVQVKGFLLPVLITWLTLFFIYYKIPSTKVRIFDALFGSFIAAILFEVAKHAFAYYAKLSSFYGAVYGVLAAIPLFLFWLYITWVVILYGAELTYQSGSFKVLSGLKRYSGGLGDSSAVFAMRILIFITSRFLKGDTPPTESEIAVETGADPVAIRTCLEVLSVNNILSSGDNQNHRTLVIDPRKISLHDVIVSFRRVKFEKEGDAVQLEADSLLIQKLMRLSNGLKDNLKLSESALKNYNLVDLVEA